MPPHRIAAEFDLFERSIAFADADGRAHRLDATRPGLQLTVDEGVALMHGFRPAMLAGKIALGGEQRFQLLRCDHDILSWAAGVGWAACQPAAPLIGAWRGSR